MSAAFVRIWNSRVDNDDEKLVSVYKGARMENTIDI